MARQDQELENKSHFSLFAYGSLRSSGEHHDIVKPYLIEAQKASLPGTIHRRKDEYWTVRDVNPCWVGSMNWEADINRLSSTTAVSRTEQEFTSLEEPLIEGEVLHLNGGARLLARLDEFEGFRGEPGTSENEYLRVAVRLALGAHPHPCFCYIDAKDPDVPEGKVGKFLEL